MAWCSKVMIPYPVGLKPRPFQFTLVDFALPKVASYIGAEMGLGKSIIAALLVNCHQGATLIICPSSLVFNIASECHKWCMKPIRISTAEFFPMQSPAVWILPDSLIMREHLLAEIKAFVAYHPKSQLIVDEAHRYCHGTSQRSKALFKIISPLFKRKTALSGTPLPNGRPMELYPILSSWTPHLINNMSVWDYGRIYCDGKQDHFGHWNFDGASNIQDLAKKVIGPFLIRMKKKDILHELPAKVEEIVFLGARASPQTEKIDKAILRKYSPADLVKTAITDKLQLPDGKQLELATYRRMLGLEKVPAVVRYIKDLLADNHESVLIFAIHREVIFSLTKALDSFRPIVITGSVPTKDRQALVNEFQQNAKRRVFIGNTIAAGTGFTLTKASLVCVAECPWQPGELDQAVDRAHRIGQLKTVFIRHLVFRDSLDSAVLETVLKKRAVIDEVMG